MARLRARRDLQLSVPGERRDLDLSAERRLCEADRHVADDVLPLPFEQRMLIHREVHIEVPRRSAIRAEFALARQADSVARFHTRRALDRERSLTLHPLPAPACRTGVGDDLTFSIAAGAGPADAEEALLRADLARTMTDRARYRRCARFGAAPLASGAPFPTGNTDLGRSAECCILKTDPKVVSEVLTRRRPCPAAAASEELLKNIAKNVPHTHTGAESAESWATLRSRNRSILVVVGAFLSV